MGKCRVRLGVMMSVSMSSPNFRTLPFSTAIYPISLGSMIFPAIAEAVTVAGGAK